MNSGAEISSCGLYRYALWRIWAPTKPLVTVLGINPSTADGQTDDHTTRKLRGFGERLGWGGYLLMNPFALRSTDQLGLLVAPDPVGPENDRKLQEAFASSDSVICAWGAAKSAAVKALLRDRLQGMRPLFQDKRLLCFGRAACGAPRHPLMLSYGTPLEAWDL